MSDTTNEYEEPGANYPDSEGGTETAASVPGEQNEPAQDVHEATDQERLDGVIAQLRSDVTGQDAAVVEKAVRSRLADTGIALREDDIAVLVSEISG